MAVTTIPPGTNAPRHPTQTRISPVHHSRSPWTTTLQFAALSFLLLTIGAVLLAAAAPGSATLRDTTPQPDPRAAQLAGPPSPPTALTPVTTDHHLVYLIDDYNLWQSLQTRLVTQQLLIAEAGPASLTTVFEFLYLPTQDHLTPLLHGLADFDSLCILEPCPTLHLIDLRTAHPTISSIPTPAR